MYSIGIDLGGTNIAVGVVNEKNEIIGRAKRKTGAKRPANEVLDDIAVTVKEAAENAKITLDEVDFVGIGTPGAVNAKEGIVLTANNLNFYNFHLAEEIEKRIGKKVFIENDANAAAYGEFLAGAGKDTSDFIAVTLGTGVGGGIVINGKLFSGFSFCGGEIGHHVIVVDGQQCSCGRKGCFEAYASATALVRQTKEAMEEHKESLMWKLTDGKIENISGRTAFDAMRQGDKTAKEVTDRYINYIGEGVINLINIFEPQKICIGGGISGEKDTLINPIREKAIKECYTSKNGKCPEITVAALGNDAGIIGAANIYKLYK